MTSSIASVHDRAPTSSQPADSARSAGTRAAIGNRKAIWTGRVLTGLAAAFLLFDASVKLLMAPEAVQATEQLGWPSNLIQGLGVLELACLALYLVPRTAVLGAVLWTGYLGGAIATHLRLQNPLFSHTLFPVYVALLIWGGLWLRDRRARAMFASLDFE